MKNEIAAVVVFFTRLVRKPDKLKKEAVERFAEKLTQILQEKYKNPEKPSKGQAYRCIRVNKFQRVDPDILKACENSCILYSDLGLPKELTLWVDPCEVYCLSVWREKKMHSSLPALKMRLKTRMRFPRKLAGLLIR
ncbi:Protein BTG3 [Lemmus lemmus]